MARTVIAPVPCAPIMKDPARCSDTDTGWDIMANEVE